MNWVKSLVKQARGEEGNDERSDDTKNIPTPNVAPVDSLNPFVAPPGSGQQQPTQASQGASESAAIQRMSDARAILQLKTTAAELPHLSDSDRARRLATIAPMFARVFATTPVNIVGPVGFL